jgi:hypothetical protein
MPLSPQQNKNTNDCTHGLFLMEKEAWLRKNDRSPDGGVKSHGEQFLKNSTGPWPRGSDMCPARFQVLMNQGLLCAFHPFLFWRTACCYSISGSCWSSDPVVFRHKCRLSWTPGPDWNAFNLKPEPVGSLDKCEGILHVGGMQIRQ